MSKIVSPKVKGSTLPNNFFLDRRIYPAPFFRKGCSKIGKEFRTAGKGSAHFGDGLRPPMHIGERGELKERGGVFRLLDANYNRAREGLRIVEDVFRFVLPNQKIARKLKKIRLDLSKTTEKIYPQLIQARDVKKDFGRKGKEKKRKNLKDLVLANFSRAEEAVRVMEEFGKLISEEAGYKFKKLRFQVYNLEKEIFLALSSFTKNT